MLYRSLIFVSVVAVIVYFMPRDGKFNYQFDINKPWKYGQLMATFDFPIYKSEEVVQREQDSLCVHFRPYFQRDHQVKELSLRKFREDSQGKLKRLFRSMEDVRFIERTLNSLYDRGILSAEALSRLAEDSVKEIRIIDGKVSVQQATEQLSSEKEAYQKLLTADTLHHRLEVLRRMGLNEYIQPNITYDEARTERAR